MPGHGATSEVDRLVAPGEEVTVQAVYDPNAHGPDGVGRADRVISVLLGARTAVALKFTVYVTP